MRTHRGTIPALPNLGELFQHHEWNMTTPRLKVPGEPEDGDGGGGDNDGEDSKRRSHFIKGAVVSLFQLFFLMMRFYYLLHLNAQPPHLPRIQSFLRCTKIQDIKECLTAASFCELGCVTNTFNLLLTRITSFTNILIKTNPNLYIDASILLYGHIHPCITPAKHNAIHHQTSRHRISPFLLLQQEPL